jgi:hypothetical protein
MTSGKLSIDEFKFRQQQCAPLIISLIKQTLANQSDTLCTSNEEQSEWLGKLLTFY